MKKVENFNQFKESLTEKDYRYGQFNNKEDHDLEMARAKWSNAKLARDVKGMEKYMKALVKANDAYIKSIKNGEID